jgi:hypothetical protein
MLVKYEHAFGAGVGAGDPLDFGRTMRTASPAAITPLLHEGGWRLERGDGGQMVAVPP